MDSWLNASDSEIEDVNTARDLVTFENIQKYYSPYSDIVASYTLGDSFTSQHRDWVGLFRSGWNDFNKFIDFQWASQDSFSHLLPRRRRVIFEAPHSKIENNKSNTFQFLYISSGNLVIGVSDLFHILDIPQESELNFDLLENALMDDDEPVIVPEPFSGLQSDSSTNPEIQSNFYLPYVANVSFDIDQHNSVLALYSPNESFNKRLMKKEMPFSTVQNNQIVEFFNPIEPEQKRNEPSWLQKIFHNTQPSVAMFENDEPTVKESKSDSAFDSNHPIKSSNQDSVSLSQDTFQDRSWMNDLQIVDRENVVENFYESDHPFSQFGSLLMTEPVEEPTDFIASSVVDEFKTRISSDSFEHLESLFSSEDWQDVSDSEINKIVETNVEVLKPTKEVKQSSSYDFFSDDINLDILFHEKESKKTRGCQKSRRSKRKNKKSRKNPKMADKEEEPTSSEDEESTSSIALLPVPSMKATKARGMRIRKKQHKSKSKRTSSATSKKQIPPEASLAVVPYKPISPVNMSSAPTDKQISSEPTMSVVPYQSFKPLKAFQPFLSSPIFSPKLSIDALVPFQYEKSSSTVVTKSCDANSGRCIRVKFPYTKKHQSLTPSARQKASCQSCKATRKMVASYKERYNTAAKQVEIIHKERADLQNQINFIKEELKELKSTKTTETQTVETLTTRVDDLTYIIPEVDGLLKGLDENNELLDMAFQSTIVDNAQLRKDMTAMQEELRHLNKQFLETEQEFKSTLQDIARRQSSSKTQARTRADSRRKRILRLRSIIGRKGRMIETLQERVNTQSVEIARNNEELSSLKKTLDCERQRANKAEAERLELKNKMDSMVAKQSTSQAEQKPTWSSAVVKQEEMKTPRVRFTMCDETINQSQSSKFEFNQPKPASNNQSKLVETNHAKPSTTSQSKLIEMSQSKAEFWKSYNAEIKKQINEGLCRTCGMSFSPFIDKRIIEEHITFHKQFQN